MAGPSFELCAPVTLLGDGRWLLPTSTWRGWDGALPNGHREERLPNTLNLTLPALRGEFLVVALDQHGISLSSGSACKAGSPEPTHVLLAMGRTSEQAHCSVRFSLSRETTEADVDETISALARVLEELESTVRFLPCK